MSKIHNRFTFYRKIDFEIQKRLLINEKTTPRNKLLEFAPGGEAVVYYNFQIVKPPVWNICIYHLKIFKLLGFHAQKYLDEGLIREPAIR